MLQTRQGFDIPQDFFSMWGGELSYKCISYIQASGGGYSDLGWAVYDSAGEGKETMHVEFQQPLEFFSLPLYSASSQSSATPKIMKFNSIGCLRRGRAKRASRSLRRKPEGGAFLQEHRQHQRIGVL
jgi:hypothetical protein